MNPLKEMLRTVRPMVRRTGYDLHRYPGEGFGVRRGRLLSRLRVDQVLDVGANVGQYVEEIREFGYSGRVLSFEPMSRACRELAVTSAGDPQWDFVRSALGAERDELEINVAANSVSSSILPMADRHVSSSPTSAYAGTERVPVERLDVLAAAAVSASRAPFLKIDTQGYESVVLDGATGVIDRMVGLELELSLVELYAGQVLMDEMVSRVQALGFRLAILSTGFWDKDTGESLQLNGVFVRKPWGEL